MSLMTARNVFNSFALTALGVLGGGSGCLDTSPSGPFSVTVSPNGPCSESNPPRFTAIVTVENFPNQGEGRLSLWQSPAPKDNGPCSTDLGDYIDPSQHVRDAPITGGAAPVVRLNLPDVVSGACFLAVFQPDPYGSSYTDGVSAISSPGQYTCP
ncbi:MAG: hypothetical protein IPJ69_13310 [Deltaproteobacteria bacterium]|nr:MAG: hypothetical protein IPJ69_13310 [Deltaproteobacteria bacterium]